MEVLSNLDLSKGTKINFLGEPCNGSPTCVVWSLSAHNSIFDLCVAGSALHIGSEFELCSNGGSVFKIKQELQKTGNPWEITGANFIGSEFSAPLGKLKKISGTELNITQVNLFASGGTPIGEFAGDKAAVKLDNLSEFSITIPYDTDNNISSKFNFNNTSINIESASEFNLATNGIIKFSAPNHDEYLTIHTYPGVDRNPKMKLTGDLIVSEFATDGTARLNSLYSGSATIDYLTVRDSFNIKSGKLSLTEFEIACGCNKWIFNASEKTPGLLIGSLDGQMACNGYSTVHIKQIALDNSINIFPFGNGAVNVFGSQSYIKDYKAYKNCTITTEPDKESYPHISYNGSEFSITIDCGTSNPSKALYTDSGYLKSDISMNIGKLLTSEFSAVNACAHYMSFGTARVDSEFKIAYDSQNKDFQRLVTLIPTGNVAEADSKATTIALDINKTTLWNKTEFLVTKTQLNEALSGLSPSGPTVNHLEFSNPVIPANCSLYEVSLAPTVFTKTPMMQLTDKNGAAQVADLCYNKTSNKVFVGIDHSTQIAAGEYTLSVFGM